MLTCSCAVAEYEFYQFKTPTECDTSPVSFLATHAAHTLPSLTQDMTGYSLTRPVHHKEYFYGIYDTCIKFRCNIESWHCESGPAVFEAALAYGEALEMADRASLFKCVMLCVKRYTMYYIIADSKLGWL